MKCRLLLHSPAPGDWNMAVDQALLELGQQPVLRLYQWNEPTLTLGYFQPSQAREQHQASAACPLLRRSTGGGAIVHDQELTYSLIVPPHAIHHPSTALYDVVHQAVADRLANHGLTARRHPDRPTSADLAAADADAPPAAAAPADNDAAVRIEATSARTEPFLCFKRRAAGDLIVWPTAAQADRMATLHQGSRQDPDGHKVLGSAQRKRDGAILQHGSVLLERSPRAPQLAGINDFLANNDRPTVEQWSHELVAAVSSALGWVPEESALTDEELELAERLRQTRFATPAWNLAR